MDKIDILLDAIEHPERYTPTEIEVMLSDPEVKKTFDLLDKTKSSLQSIVIPDVEDEWKRFESKHCNSGVSHRLWFRNLLSRNVAASIAICIVSFTAVAAIVGIGISHLKHQETSIPPADINPKTTIATSQTNSPKTEDDEKVLTSEIVVFDNETLENIISRIAAYYEYKVVFKEEASKSLRLYFRWDQALTIEEVVERLDNFEQIHLTINDNTIKIGR
ncbi:MAG: DUF4974 domain-containing protein [Muribaculaceae bacterium]|nr:DUF4974 domain-containing protein [Muribaculaceae bacterium]